LKTRWPSYAVKVLSSSKDNFVVEIVSLNAFDLLMNVTQSLKASIRNPCLLVVPQENLSTEELLMSEAGRGLNIRQKIFFWERSSRRLLEGYWINGFLVIHDLATVTNTSKLMVPIKIFLTLFLE